MKKRIIGLSIVILILLAGSLAGIFYIRAQAKQSTCYAQIYRDNELLQTVDLSHVEEPYQIRLDYGEDDYNIIEVREGEIGIVDASCPDLLCKNMGFISNSLMPITCLPNHLVIRLVTEEDQNDSEGLDGLSY